MQSLTASGLLALGTHTMGLTQGVGSSTSSMVSSDWSRSSSFSTLSRIAKGILRTGWITGTTFSSTCKNKRSIV